MKTIKLFGSSAAFAFAALLASTVEAAFVEVANAVDDFAPATVAAIGSASNPNGNWRYEGAEFDAGSGDDNYFLFGTQRERTNVGPGWNGGGHTEDFEGVYLDLSGSFPGTLSMHPASIGGIDHNVRIGYIVQQTGVYRIDYTVEDSNDLDGQFGIGPFEVSLRVGAALAADSSLTTVQGPTTVGEGFSAGPVAFQTPQFNATVGQVIYLIIDGQGNFGTDDARVSMSVTAFTTPEPSTFPLGILGLLSLGFVAWRRRRR